MAVKRSNAPAASARIASQQQPAAVQTRDANRGEGQLSAASPSQQLHESPRQLAQQQRTAALFGPAASGPPVQRKILVNGAPYPVKATSSPAVQQAASDEFLRRYESEKEVTDHLDAKAPTPFGLVEQRALWYRIPLLGQRFFVFGESHAAVRGDVIKKASNIQAPILDEKLTGWSVGQQDLGKGGDVGLDENTSKLMRALEGWNPEAFSKKASGVQPPPAIPEIPVGESSTRDRKRGTYRLVVHGEDTHEAWWKPAGQQDAPQSTHDFEGEVLSAIEGLFAKVFADEILSGSLDKVSAKTSTAWNYFQTKKWLSDPLNALAIQKNIRIYLYNATRAKLYGEYAKLQKGKHGADTLAENQKTWSADNYRDEFIFVRVLEAAEKGSYAFATMGDLHLEALKDRFIAKGIPFVSMSDFFDRYSQDAVDTQAIAYKNSPQFRVQQRLSPWVQTAFKVYPNLQQWHLDMLTPRDVGEFALQGKVSKWEQGNAAPSGPHDPVMQQFFRDLAKVYPNGEQYISTLTLEQIGEFILEGKIGEWDAMRS